MIWDGTEDRPLTRGEIIGEVFVGLGMAVVCAEIVWLGVTVMFG